MLLQAGGLAIRAGNRLELSPAGIKASSTPPAEVLRGLWRKWLKTTMFDACLSGCLPDPLPVVC